MGHKLHAALSFWCIHLTIWSILVFPVWAGISLKTAVVPELNDTYATQFNQGGLLKLVLVPPHTELLELYKNADFGALF